MLMSLLKGDTDQDEWLRLLGKITWKRAQNVTTRITKLKRSSILNPAFGVYDLPKVA